MGGTRPPPVAWDDRWYAVRQRSLRATRVGVAGGPRRPGTPVAHDAGEVLDLAAKAPDLDELCARQSVCRACDRLVAWREKVAVERRRAFADEEYWGRPIAGWGEAEPRILIVGLAPAAHGGNRTGRIFTGDRSGTGCSRPCTGWGWPRCRRACTPATGSG